MVLRFLSLSRTASRSIDAAPIRFNRIAALQPRETRQVFFGVQARQLALVNERGERWLQPGRYRLGLDVPTRQWRDIELTGLAMQLHTDGAAASSSLVLMSALIQRRHRPPDCASHRYGIRSAVPYALPTDGDWPTH
jgi:hypothetical protein